MAKKTHHGQTKRVKLANLTPSRFATLESRFGKLEEKEENDMKAKNKKLVISWIIFSYCQLIQDPFMNKIGKLIFILN